MISNCQKFKERYKVCPLIVWIIDRKGDKYSDGDT